MKSIRYTMINPPIRLCAVISVATCFLLSGIAGANLIPDWTEDTRAVQHIWLFLTDDLEPAADFSDNPFGTASVAISPDPLFGMWQDPEDEIHSYGAEGNGAWQVGRGEANSGRMDFSIPIGHAEDAINHAVLYVNVDYLRDVPGHPLMEVDGEIVAFESDAFSYTHPDKFLDDWWTRSWRVDVFGISDNTVNMSIIGNPSAGALVDRVEIYAIPEPRIIVLLLMGFVYCYFKRKDLSKSMIR